MPAKPSLKLSLQKEQPAKLPQPAGQQEVPTGGSSYAGVTAVAPDEDNSFTVVTNKKEAAEKGPQPLKPLYGPNDQKVVVQIHPDTPPQPSVQITWQCLQIANRAIREYQKDLDYCFIRCHVQTSTKAQGSDYLPYLEAVKAKLEEEGKLRVTAIDGEPRWSKFLLHGVPTTATMEEVAMSIQQSYPAGVPRSLSNCCVCLIFPAPLHPICTF